VRYLSHSSCALLITVLRASAVRQMRKSMHGGGRRIYATPFTRITTVIAKIIITLVTTLYQSYYYHLTVGARGRVDDWSTMLHISRSRWFDSRLGHRIFNWPNLSSRIMTLGSTQPPTEISTSKSSWGGNLDVSQPHGLPWPVTEIAILFLTLQIPVKLCYAQLFKTLIKCFIYKINEI
jgi:hypothetical protein